MLLWTLILLMVTAMAASVPMASAQEAPTLAVDGSAGPLSVPINTSLPILATGLTPLGTFTYAAYTGGDCGLGLVEAQDLQANAEGIWDWSRISLSAPATLWIRVTDGPNNSNCVQIAWQAVVPTDVPPTDVPPTDVPPTEVPPTDVPPTKEPTDVPSETPAGSPTTTPTETPAGSPTTTPDPTGTGTATAPATTAPTDPPTATATAPVSALPTTGNDGGQSSSTTGFVLLIAGSLLMLGAATVSRRRGTTTR